MPGSTAEKMPVVFGKRFALSEPPHFFSLSSSKKEERAGERIRLSPRSFLARRERQNAAGVLRAE